MKNSTPRSALSNALQFILITVILTGMFNNSYAQIPPNAVNADPAAMTISQVPLGSVIVGEGVLRFRFANEATSTNSTGQIPANSVRLTLSFPGVYAYTSVNSIPKFAVEDADSNPFGVVHLVNNAVILEGEVIDLQLNVRAVSNGNGSVTFNVDRVTPIIVANILTGNDNSSAVFNASTTLPVSLIDFNVQKTNCTAKLSWKTAGETNIQSYVVEMSNDRGASYNAIGTVEANSTGERSYNFTHQMSNNNAYLYRIKITEITDGYNYSEVVRINSGCGDVKNRLLVYPAPATTSITLTMSDNALLNTRVNIVDVTGRVQSNFIMNANTKKIDIVKLPAGVYAMQLQDGSAVKFIKQ
ncbi:MAG: T9SS type A sorting domain-containing protein [Ferruginibacter sp.]